MAAGVSVVKQRLCEEIASASYRQATETFCRLVAAEQVPLREVIQTAISAAAPFVQVPSHLMRKPDGDLRGVNYDHTVLGWRGAIALLPQLPGTRAVLPTVQAMWYVPQGLNVWEQLICEFPGHYARDAEKCGLRYPGEDPAVDRYDGPAWNPPKIHFDDHAPLTGGSVDERLERLGWAIAEGDRVESYGLFLGLADDPSARARLKERLLFAGIIDLQDTIINRGGYQNIGHKALRARALVDIADYFGWDQAHEISYTVVPDLGCSPRLYGLWTEISNLVRIELPEYRGLPKRARPLTNQELEELTYTLLWGGPYEVNDVVSGLYRAGAGMLDLSDGVVIACQRYLANVVENPHAFLHPTHAFDYLNVVNAWIRNYDNPHQAKGVYLAARFFNDTVRSNAMFPRDPHFTLEPRQNFREWADAIPLDRLPPVLLEQILQQDAPRSGALVDSYLERTAERQELLDTITYAACHFQNDPHVLRNCASSLEEYAHNQTVWKDDIIRGYVKHQSRYIKRAKVLEAHQMFEAYFGR